MGYGQQPFVVFKHNDIDRSHIHIVSVCVNEQGVKISDKFEKIRSMKVCRELERKYGLIPATGRERNRNEKIFKPVDYEAGDVKSQVASVVRHLPNYYQYQTLGEYNALLSLFNITVEKVGRETQGKFREGLLYIPLNERGEKAGHPLKASLFGKNAGLAALEQHFAKCKAELKNNPTQKTIQTAVSTALKLTSDEKTFKKQLAEKGINAVVRRNEAGRIYGITFIDHNSKTVWNGSRLGKEFSANTFIRYWNHSIAPDVKDADVDQSKRIFKANDADFMPSDPHHLFDFLSEEKDEGLLDVLGGFLPEARGEDYEELNFENEMKKKMRRKKRS